MMFFYAEGVNSFFYVEVNSVHTINCIVHDGITGLSCLIQVLMPPTKRVSSRGFGLLAKKQSKFTYMEGCGRSIEGGRAS